MEKPETTAYLRRKKQTKTVIKIGKENGTDIQ